MSTSNSADDFDLGTSTLDVVADDFRDKTDDVDLTISLEYLRDLGWRATLDSAAGTLAEAGSAVGISDALFRLFARGLTRIEVLREAFNADEE